MAPSSCGCDLEEGVSHDDSGLPICPSCGAEIYSRARIREDGGIPELAHYAYSDDEYLEETA